MVEAFDFRFGIFEMCKCESRLLKHSSTVLSHKVLGQIRHHAVLRFGNGATGRGAFACEHFEQGAFARSVFTHQGDAVFVVDLKRDVLKQSCSAELYGKVVYAEHCTMV